jgi:hypothetical protein
MPCAPPTGWRVFSPERWVMSFLVTSPSQSTLVSLGLRGRLMMNTPDDIPESETYVDCSGKQRVFSLKCHQVPTGWAVLANEVTDNDFGYRFEGFSPSNPYLALGQVRAKIQAGLATRYLSAAETEPTLSHGIVRGYISWDRTTDSPVLVVDGRPLSMFDIERILGSYEGWNVELRIVEASE